MFDFLSDQQANSPHSIRDPVLPRKLPTVIPAVSFSMLVFSCPSKQLGTRPIYTDFNGANFVFMRPYLGPP